MIIVIIITSATASRTRSRSRAGCERGLFRGGLGPRLGGTSGSYRCSGGCIRVVGGWGRVTCGRLLLMLDPSWSTGREACALLMLLLLLHLLLDLR